MSLTACSSCPSSNFSLQAQRGRAQHDETYAQHKETRDTSTLTHQQAQLPCRCYVPQLQLFAGTAAVFL